MMKKKIKLNYSPENKNDGNICNKIEHERINVCYDGRNPESTRNSK